MKEVIDLDGNTIMVSSTTPTRNRGGTRYLLTPEEAQRHQDKIDADEPARKREEAIAARRNAYGSIEDQLDMWYWDQVNGTQDLVDHIATVKTKYPKSS